MNLFKDLFFFKSKKLQNYFSKKYIMQQDIKTNILTKY